MSTLAWLRTPALPTTASLSRPLGAALSGALAAFGLVQPFSVAGTSLLLAVLLLLALAAAPAVWRAQPWREPTLAIGLLLLVFIGLHTLLLQGWGRDLLHVFTRYKELLLAPLLYALFRLAPHGGMYVRALLLGAAGYALAHWIGLYWEPLGDALRPRYIGASFQFAVLAFLLLERARRSPRPWPLRAAALFLALTVLFATPGRTGYVVLLCLFAWAAWIHSPRRWRLWSLLLVPLLMAGVALTSSSVQMRLAETTQALAQPPQEPFSSSEIRIELVRHGFTLAREHFLLGGGYARYSELHREAVRHAYGSDAQRRQLAETFWAGTDNPHSEYLMQVVGGGAIALALFLAWLAAPLLRRDAAGRRSPEIAGLVLAFAVGCLFNSMLMDFVEGHFYSALLAWLLAQQASAQAA